MTGISPIKLNKKTIAISPRMMCDTSLKHLISAFRNHR